jgi:flagellin-like protein
MRKEKRAISPIVATIILVAVTVLAGATIATYMAGRRPPGMGVTTISTSYQILDEDGDYYSDDDTIYVRVGITRGTLYDPTVNLEFSIFYDENETGAATELVGTLRFQEAASMSWDTLSTGGGTTVTATGVRYATNPAGDLDAGMEWLFKIQFTAGSPTENLDTINDTFRFSVYHPSLRVPVESTFPPWRTTSAPF